MRVEVGQLRKLVAQKKFFLRKRKTFTVALYHPDTTSEVDIVGGHKALGQVPGAVEIKRHKDTTQDPVVSRVLEQIEQRHGSFFFFFFARGLQQTNKQGKRRTVREAVDKESLELALDVVNEDHSEGDSVQP